MPVRLSSSIALAAVLGAALPACATFDTAGGPTSVNGLSSPGVAVCGQFQEWGPPGARLLAQADSSRQYLVTAMSCFDQHVTPANPAERAYVAWHQQYDDRRYDPLLASLIVLDCAAGDRCQPPYDYVVGQVEYYARIAPPEQVAPAVARLSVSDAVARAYLERYAAARARVLSAVGMLPPTEDTTLVVAVPRTVRQQRLEYFQRFANDWAAFDALMPALTEAVHAGRPDHALLEGAIALRDQHVARCVAETPFSTTFCWNGTLARPLTWGIAWMALLVDDPVLAYTEADTYSRGVTVMSAAAHIAMAQYAARDIGRSYSWDPWPVTGVGPDPGLTERVRALSDRLEWVGEGVERVITTRASDTASIRFKTRVSGSTSFDCDDRYQIRADASGRPRLVRRCRPGQTETTRTANAPVTVPAGDVPGLRNGNFALVVFDPRTRRGRLLEARPTVHSEQRAYHRIRFTDLKEGLDRRDQEGAAVLGSR